MLTPLAFDPGHPFPHISNQSKNLAVAVKHEGRTKFARIKLPPVLPRFIPLPPTLAKDETVLLFLEDVVCANVQTLFPGTSVKSAHIFRVIRDTDMVIQEDEADDLLETVDQGLRQLSHGAPSLLQVDERMPRRVLDILVENFEIDDDVLVRTSHRLGFGDWLELDTTPPAGTEGHDLRAAHRLGPERRRRSLRAGHGIATTCCTTRSIRSSRSRRSSRLPCTTRTS